MLPSGVPESRQGWDLSIMQNYAFCEKLCIKSFQIANMVKSTTNSMVA